jgi:phosphate:Na+ symporter
MTYLFFILQMAAGAGLLYFGIQSLSTAAQRLGSGPFRHFIRKHLHRIWLGALWGIGLNALIGSSTVIALILTGFISGGVLSFTQAYPISVWGTLGTIVILYLATFNFQWIAFLLLSIGGLTYAFVKNPTIRLIAESVMGLGLLLYGLTLMSATGKQFGFVLPEWVYLYSLLLVPIGFLIQVIFQS